MMMPITLTTQEKKHGSLWMVAFLVLFPRLLGLTGLGAAEKNLVLYWLNFAGVLWIFRRFLLRNLLVGLDRWFPVIWYAALAYLGFETLSEMLAILTWMIHPEFINTNDQVVAGLIQASPLLAGTVVVLVPIAEETLFRGLIFRGLWDRNRALAYLVSILVFAAVHVVGYIGVLSPLELVLSLIQYLPAGYCLAFAYRYSGSILSPILTHMAVNLMAVAAMR